MELGFGSAATQAQSWNQASMSGDWSLRCWPRTECVRKGKGKGGRQKKPLEVTGLWIRPLGPGNQTSSFFWLTWTLRGVGWVHREVLWFEFWPDSQACWWEAQGTLSCAFPPNDGQNVIEVQVLPPPPRPPRTWRMDWKWLADSAQVSLRAFGLELPHQPKTWGGSGFRCLASLALGDLFPPLFLSKCRRIHKT